MVRNNIELINWGEESMLNGKTRECDGDVTHSPRIKINAGREHFDS